jgi:predicted Zn-dependent protease
MNCEACHDGRRSPGFDRHEVLASVTCPPMRPDEPALVFARERAIEAIEERRARGNDDPQDDYLLGLGLLGLGRTDEGARHLLDSAVANQEDVRQAVESAHALDRHGLSEEAIVVLRTYLDHQTGDLTVNLEHARLLLEARDPAARDPREALAVLDLRLPDDEADYTVEQLPVQLLQVDAHEALGESDKAERLLKTLAMRYQDNPDVRRRLAQRGLLPR